MGGGEIFEYQNDEQRAHEGGQGKITLLDLFEYQNPLGGMYVC